MNKAMVGKTVWKPEHHIVNEEAPKYLYGNTKSGLLTNSTNSTLDDCSPFCDEPDFYEKRETHSTFFALRIEPTAPLEFSALTYNANENGELAKDATRFFIEKGKERKMSEFNCVPMVFVRDKWEEHPELAGLEIKEWTKVLSKQNLFPYPHHGYGSEEDMDKWFEEEYVHNTK